MQNPKVSRRDFLSRAGKGALALTMFAPLAGSRIFAWGKKTTPMAPLMLDLTKKEYAALAKVGGAIKIPSPLDKARPIIVTRTTDITVTAVSSKCTHLGCELELPVDNVIHCKCHGSAFDTSGNFVHGPAKKNLYIFSAVLDGSTVTIKQNA